MASVSAEEVSPSVDRASLDLVHILIFGFGQNLKQVTCMYPAACTDECGRRGLLPLTTLDLHSLTSDLHSFSLSLPIHRHVVAEIYDTRIQRLSTAMRDSDIRHCGDI